MLYRSVLRPAMFSLPTETAHAVASAGLGLAQRVPGACRLLRALGPADDPLLQTSLCGVPVAAPVGLAAGFDKHATMFNALGALGFAAVEVGTITALAQPGNPRPRLFRLPQDRALINRMGFNNPGAEAAAQALARVPREGVVLGVNLGKSKVTALEDAPADYARSAELLAGFADYLVVNVSSPNTPGLRSLQSVDALAPVVRAVRSRSDKPLLVKIAPDLADEDVDAVVDLCLAEGAQGVVATNTTVRRDGLRTTATEVEALGAGGLSGPVLRERARAVVARVYRRAAAKLCVVGVGGVSRADDVWDLLCAGASLVQVYTGFVYEGPAFAWALREGLAARMRAEGVARVQDLVGRDHRGGANA